MSNKPPGTFTKWMKILGFGKKKEKKPKPPNPNLLHYPKHIIYAAIAHHDPPPPDEQMQADRRQMYIDALGYMPGEEYDNDGNITHYLEPTTEYTNRFHKKELLPYQTARTKELDKTVKCRVLNKDGFINKHDMHSIYISGSMKTWPCCWMEFDSILETNDLRKDSFEIINKEFYQKISSKWGNPQCLDVCVRKCSIETIADRLQPYESGMTA